MARGSASLLPSHGRGIWPRDVLKKVSRGLSRVEASYVTLSGLFKTVPPFALESDVTVGESFSSLSHDVESDRANFYTG